MEETIKIWHKNGTGRYMVSESSVELLLSKMRVSRIGEKCYINLATPEGGAEIEMSQKSATGMVRAMLTTLPQDEVSALLLELRGG